MMTAEGSNSSNGTSLPRRSLQQGIYAPAMTFFTASEDIDIPTIKFHAVRLAKAGLAGLVTMGSNGEGVHCSRDEKCAVTRATRSALDEAGFGHVPVIIGATEGSVRGTVELCRQGEAAGADYALVLPPSYFRALMDEEAIVSYFNDVADASPLPLVLYNYPAAVAGIDLNSDTLIALAAHRNIVGTKFTCCNTGKLTRVSRATNAVALGRPRRASGSGYMTFGGMCDFTVQTLASGGSAVIAGGANLMPRVCVRVWDLWADGKRDDAMELQRLLSTADWVLTKAGIAGTKMAIQSYFGYGGHPRRPLKKLSPDRVQAVKEGAAEVMALEMSLPDKFPAKA